MNPFARAAHVALLARKQGTPTAVMDWDSDRGWTLVSGSAGELPTSFTDLVTEGFRKNAVVSGGVRVITQAISDAPLAVYRETGDDELTRLPGHPAEVLWTMPNPAEPGVALIERLVQHYLLGGQAVIQKVRSAGRQIVGLRAINPTRLMSVFVDEDGDPVSWKIARKRSGTPETFDAEDILLIPDIDPLNEVFGMPRLLAAALQIRSDRSADQYVAEMLANHGTPGVIVGVAPETKPDAIERAETKWEEKFGPGRGRGKIGFIPGAATITEIGFSLKDLEFPELRRVSGERILAILGVDPILVGLATAARGGTLSGAEYEAAMKRLWQLTIVPLFTRWEAYFNAFLAPDWGDIRLYFNTDNVQALRDDRDKASERALRMTQAGVYSEEEIRTETGHDPKATTGSIIIRPLGIIASPPGLTPPKPAPPALPPGKPNGGGANGGNGGNGGGKVALLAAGNGQKVVQFVGWKGITKDERIECWKMFDAFARSLEPTYESAARELFDAMQSDTVGLATHHLVDRPTTEGGTDKAAAAPEAKQITYDSLLDLQRRLGLTKVQYHREWRARFQELTRYTVQLMAGSLGGDLGVSFDLANAYVQEFIDTRANLLAGVSDATFDILRSLIREGYDAGLSSRQLADAIEEVFGQGYSRDGVQILSAAQRARLIAITETTAAANGGALALVQSGPVRVEKEWANRGDDKVRESHQDQPVGVGGERVAEDEPFSNGLQFPGDPSGEGEDSCNCRCSMLFYPVAAK